MSIFAVIIVLLINTAGFYLGFRCGIATKKIKQENEGTVEKDRKSFFEFIKDFIEDHIDVDKTIDNQMSEEIEQVETDNGEYKDARNFF